MWGFEGHGGLCRRPEVADGSPGLSCPAFGLRPGSWGISGLPRIGRVRGKGGLRSFRAGLRLHIHVLLSTPPPPPAAPLAVMLSMPHGTWLRSMHGETEARAHFFPSLFLQAFAEITFYRQAWPGQRRVLCANNGCLFPGKLHRVTRQLCLARPPMAGLHSGRPLQRPVRREESNPSSSGEQAGLLLRVPGLPAPQPLHASHLAPAPGRRSSEQLGAAAAGGGRRQGWAAQSGPSLPGSNPEHQRPSSPAGKERVWGSGCCSPFWGLRSEGRSRQQQALRLFLAFCLLALPRVSLCLWFSTFTPGIPAAEPSRPPSCRLLLDAASGKGLLRSSHTPHP